MKFIHTADLHLDSPFDNLRNDRTPDAIWQLVYNSTYRSFARIVKAAVDNQVDFVLIVGDLFDRQDQNVRAQSFLKHQLSILDQHQIPVLLSFGNHDYFSGDYHQLNYPKNTYIFPKDVTTRTLRLNDNSVVKITGFSYGSQWESQRMINKFPVRSDCDYQIGMIHGQISSGKSNYAPFSLNELLDKHYDYWALGHIHKRQSLNLLPPVIYPGNIQGRNPNETGEKGFELVSSQNHFQPKFCPTSLIDWNSLLIQIDNDKDEEEVVNQILSSIQRQNYSKFNLVDVRLHVKSINGVSSDLLTVINNQNLLDQVQSVLRSHYQDCHAWVYQVDLVQSHQNRLRMKSDVWEKSSGQVFTLKNVDRLAKKLFRYPFINQNFNNEKAIHSLKWQTTQLILNHRGSQDDN